ncbi:MAG: PAS domain S-box protein [Polyangiaceae bacterium]|nr:PAS domain S-box protein [Polyangiaceae bacterium]
MESEKTLSAERYRQILEAAPDAMVIVDHASKIVFVNAQTERMFGYARADLLGKNLDTLIPDLLRLAHSAHVGDYFAQPTPRPMGSGLELFGRRADGSELAIEVSLSPVGSGDRAVVAAAIRDVTARRRIEAAARLNAGRLGSAVESIQDAIALFDASDRLVLCNSVYRRLIGESLPGSLVGRTYDAILDAWMETLDFDSDEERARFRASRLAERGDPKGATDTRTRDGRSLRITSRRTVEKGIVETIWDLTDDVRRQKELHEARALAEAGSAAKSEFLSSMSHELRTPLNAILGFAQLLQRDKKAPLSDRHRERVDQILKGGEHLLRLIDDILDLSRIEAGGISISTEPVGVSAVLAEVQRTLEPIAAREGIHVAVDPLPEDVPMVSADRTRFVQILMNFGSNAIKYNRSSGDVTFTVSTPTPGFVRVSVRDTGMGIPTEKQDKLFQPFQRAGQESGPIEGTGIGLVITKRLASLMRGDVGFRSVPGEGSEFWVEIPVDESGAHRGAQEATLDAMQGRLAGDGRRLVLYIEDNPANVTFMRDLVSTFDNLDLLTAPTAEMGVELARSRRPEVIIMDINLPGMSGLDALYVLRAVEDTQDIPIIALTAAASERDKQRGIQAGFFQYLTKPVKVDELMSALEALLSP